MASVRQPAVAGQFYEGSEARLRSQIEGCFRHELGPGEVPQVAERGPRRIVGLVSPHAGYMFSGPPAAHGFSRLARDGVPEVVVLLGPNHRFAGRHAAIMSEGWWRTPLGDMAIEADTARAIRAKSPLIVEDPGKHGPEHSLEVQLPFLQYLYGDRIRLVPISLLRQDHELSQAVGEALAAALVGKNAVIIASTDLSHQEPLAVAERMDRAVIDRMAAMDAAGLIDVVRAQHISMCGYGPVAAMLIAARQLGANRCDILKYSTSGDILRDGRPGVGYVSAQVWRDEAT